MTTHIDFHIILVGLSHLNNFIPIVKLKKMCIIAAMDFVVLNLCKKVNIIEPLKHFCSTRQMQKAIT